jgi:hypothetical protein
LVVSTVGPLNSSDQINCQPKLPEELLDEELLDEELLDEEELDEEEVDELEVEVLLEEFCTGGVELELGPPQLAKPAIIPSETSMGRKLIAEVR